MAEKDPGFNTEPLPDEQLNFKKRARRRLVGAIALALLAVIVLPMVMDQEPKPLTQDIQIRIPTQEPGSALSRLNPKPSPTPLPVPPKASEPVPAQPQPAAAILAAKPDMPAQAGQTKTSAAPSQERPAERQTAEKPGEKPAPKSQAQASESARATAILNDENWIVQLGAYRDMANVKLLQGKIKELGYPSYTEKVETPQGLRTRVRGGPFASREAAEKAQERLKKIGVGAPLGGVVAEK